MKKLLLLLTIFIFFINYSNGFSISSLFRNNRTDENRNKALKINDELNSLFKRSKTASRTVQISSRENDPRKMTMLFKELAQSVYSLSEDEQKEVNKFLMRPDLMNDQWSSSFFYTGEELSSLTFVRQGPFTVHYTTSGESATTIHYANKVLEAFNQAYLLFCGTSGLGYIDIKDDSGNDSGITSIEGSGDGIGFPLDSGEYDIYLIDLSSVYAITVGHGGNGKISSHIVFENDFSESVFQKYSQEMNVYSTAVHELFHAVQYSYDATDPAWLNEATAVYMEDVTLNDLYNWDLMNTYQEYVPIYFQNINLGLTSSKNYHMYGSSLFFKFLTGRLRANKEGAVKHEIVRKVWEKCGEEPNKDNAYNAIVQTLGEYGYSYREAVKEFYLWAWTVSEQKNYTSIAQENENWLFKISVDDNQGNISYQKPKITSVTNSGESFDSAYVKSYPVELTPSNTYLLQDSGANYYIFYPEDNNGLTITIDTTLGSRLSAFIIEYSNDNKIIGVKDLEFENTGLEINLSDFKVSGTVKKVVLGLVSTNYQKVPFPHSYTIKTGGKVSIQAVTDSPELRAYPVPFRGGNLNYSFALDTPFSVWLKLTDSRNRLVESIIEGDSFNANFIGSIDLESTAIRKNLANGVYFLKFKAINSDGYSKSATSKVVLMR